MYLTAAVLSQFNVIRIHQNVNVLLKTERKI